MPGNKNIRFSICSIIINIIIIIQFIVHQVESKELTTNDFDEWDKNQKYLFVLFYSSESSCKQCVQVLSDWKSFENRLDNVQFFAEVNVGRVDCSVNRDLCSREDIQELPMAKLYVEINKITRIEMNYESKEYDRNSLDMFLMKQITRFGFQDSQKEQEPDESIDETDATTSGEERGFTIMPLKAKNGLYELTDDDSSLFLSHGQHFVNFYAPWCSHCQNLKPKWEMIAKSLENNEQVKISQINCQENIYTCKMQFKIKEYPTLLWISNGKIVARYKGSHELDHIKSFINSQLTDFELEKLLKKYSDVDSGIEELEIDYRKKSSNVLLLNSDNFKMITDSGWTFVHFTVPWSKHCRQMKSEWDKFSITAPPNSLKVAKVDCSIQEKLCTMEKIDSYPTLLLYNDGHRFPEYDNTLRTADSFLQYFNVQSNNNQPKKEL
ncbi:Thioredoxin domain-containing protein 5 [Dermatophagoides pteronyssinus]|uniref:Thioredoxin domain-containing protein 5 homolog n=2 Tax=Dermatophagoides pteronyssinus TaxID=6956 RepID=A0A6P6XMX8_DERPT|nr:thioredoxin domain-containing protein 5 homolog [Dermatophagoides pteronyssinus]KAH9412359.1 Thioredoxin domain-containing protein 5 [Dermatophagoides pteronyssinus]